MTSCPGPRGARPTWWRPRVWHRLALIGLAFTLPLVTSTYLLMVNNGQRIEFSHNEQRGLDYLRPLEALLTDLTADKSQDRLAATGQATAEQVRAARARVDADFAALTAIDAQVGADLRTTGAHLNASILPATLARTWRTWESGQHDAGTDDAFQSQLVTNVRTLISYVGVTSNLVLDPELSPYHIADALAVRVPAIIDHTRSVGDTVDGLLASGRIMLPDRTGVAATVSSLTADADGLQEDLFTTFQDGGGSAEARAVQNALGPLLTTTYLNVASLCQAITQDFVQASQIRLDRPTLSHAVEQAVGGVSALTAALTQREGAILQARIDMDSMSRQLALAAVLAVLAVTVLLVVWQSRRITTDVGTVSRVAASLAGGDLTGRARVRSRDEIGVMATAFNGMAEQLQEMLESQQRAQRSLRSERDFVDAVLDIAGSLVLVMDADGRIVRFNRACEITTGYAAEKVVGRLCWELFLLPEDRPCIEAAFTDLHPDKFPQNFECPWLTYTGDQRRIAWSNTALVDEAGTVTHVIATGIDVTAQRAAEAALREAKERFQKAFDYASIGMCLVDVDGGFTQVNRALCEMLGRSEAELLALRVGDVTHPDDLSASMATVAAAKDGFAAHHIEKRYLRADGRTVWAQVTVCTIHSENGESPYFVTQVEDVTERREAEARLVRQALHDPLTGLPNRTLLMDRLRQVLARADRHPELTAVLFIDLDGFKDVNDSLGHDVGDEVLTEVGRRLQANIRPLDTVARLGGDEFVVLCQDLAGEQNVVEISERLAGVLAEPVVVGTFEVVVTASVGIALANGHNPAPEDLLREADAAMYGAKTRGKNRCEIFDAGLQERAVDRIAIASALRQGLRDDRFVLHFQPVVDMVTGDTVSVESLVRLDDPDRGLLAPDTFIQVAEDSGLIVPIGTSVLEQACRQLMTWRRTGAVPPSLRTAVNLSARQATRPDLAATIERVLAESGLEPCGLTLELTETVLMEADSATLRQLERIRELGVGLGIDDFGTGYSSLTYLKRLPVSFVKIDRSFVAGLETDPSDREIVTAVIRLGQALGLTTIAEGVEEPAQFEMLRALGCDQAQGYLLGRPKAGPPGDVAVPRALRTAVS